MLVFKQNGTQRFGQLCRASSSPSNHTFGKLTQSLLPKRRLVNKAYDTEKAARHRVLNLPRGSVCATSQQWSYFSSCTYALGAQNQEMLQPKNIFTTDVILSAYGEIIDKNVDVDPHVLIDMEPDVGEEIESVGEEPISMQESDISPMKAEGDQQKLANDKERRTGVRFMPHVPDRSKFVEGQKLSHWEQSKVVSVVEGFIFLNMTNDAVKALNVCLRRGHVFKIETYNKVLQCAVTAKDTVMTSMILESMKTQAIDYDLHTYAVLLQKAELDGHVDEIKLLLSKMKKRAYDVNLLFQKCPLTIEQGKMVCSAINRIVPEFTPQKQQVPVADNITTRLLHNVYQETDINPVEVLEKIQERSSCHVKDDPRGNKLDVEALTKDDIFTCVNEQLEKETNYYAMIKSVETKVGSSKRLAKRQKLYSEIHQNWKEKFVKELKDMIEMKRAGSEELDTRVKNVVFPYLCLLEPEQYATIVLNETIPILSTQPLGISVVNLCRRIGDMIFNVYSLRYKEFQGCHDVVRNVYDNYGMYGLDPGNMCHVKPREMWNFCEGQYNFYSNDKHSNSLWPLNVKLTASAVLLDIFKKIASVEVKPKQGGVPTTVPALQHERQFAKGRFLGVLKLHSLVSKLFKSHMAETGEIAIEAFKIPMLIPPRPWTSVSHGGFLLHPSPFVRTILADYGRNDLKIASDKGNLNSIFDAMNYLASCPWKVNKRILSIMVDLFNDKGDSCLEITGPVTSGLPKVKRAANMTPEERAAHLKQRKIMKKVNHEMFALRMGQLYHLSVAQHLKDRLFWLPYNLDFRGRVYTIPPYCTHIGDDVTRGLMLFGKGKPLGKEGLNWLKIHLVNLQGVKKKASLEERLDYANQMIDEIIDSADNPLSGRQWWKTADEPWQFLATCMEVTDAVRSPDPEQFVSYLPVHQDGSCNGLQHYAALGRDQYGAEKVNVSPSEYPQDVYSEVAFLAEKQRLQDASNGHELAIKLEGKVTRKVIKQTVMTIVYGVTHVGGRLQIERQLKDVTDFDSYTLFKSSDYLVKIVFASIGQLFNSARNIQDWLTRSAVDICAVGQPVSWVTPLGLPIVQPYHMKTKESIKTPLQVMTTRTHFDETRKPDTRKQKGGFPPNYVHSLDSTHMLLTALHCQKEGILFASVHDSFWTHAADVSAMGKICREQFFQLHSEPLLENLQQLFQDRYGSLRKKNKGKFNSLTFDDLPGSGSFDLKKVLESTYFFS